MMFSRKSGLNWILSLTLILSLIAWPLFGPGPVYGADTATFSITPATITIGAGESFDVTVQLTTNAPTNAAGFQLSWIRSDGAASLTCTGIDKGSFYTNGILVGGGRYSDNSTIEQYAVGLLGSQQPAGTGPLAVVHLRATQPGTYNLHLFECQASLHGELLTSVTMDGQAVVPAGPPPQSPFGLTATSVMWNCVSLHWSDNSTDEDSFLLQRALDTGFPADNTTDMLMPADATDYTDNTTATSTTYYYRVVAHNANGYSAPSNVVQVNTPPPPPDLVLTQLTQTLYDDNSFDVRLIVSNQGTTQSPVSIAGIYIDGVHQPDFDLTISALNPGSSQTRVAGVFYAAAPDHNIRVCADNNNQVIELSESNNCQQNMMHVPWPDLAVSQVFENVTGNQFYVSFTVCNNGEKGCRGTTAAAIYINGEQKLIHQVPALAVGQCYSTSQPLGPWTVTLPAPVIRVCADALNTEIEMNEQNNCLQNTLPLPDLDVTGVSAQWVTPGLTYNIVYTVRNQGDGPAAASTTSIKIDGTVVQTVSCSALEAGSSDNRTVGPFTLTPDSDTIDITSDSGSAVFESIEDNNSVGIIWNGLPDLQVTALSKQWINQGRTYNITYLVRNLGTGPSAPSSTSISIDGQVIQTLPCSALATGASENRTAGPFILSPDVDAIVVTADSASTITEINETNNSQSDTLNGIPDLRVTQIAPRWTTEYTIYEIIYRVQNVGTYPAPASATSISIDGAIIQTLPCPALDTGAFDVKTLGAFTFSPEADILAVTADVSGDVAESNEINNMTELSWEVSPRWDINMDHVLDALDLSVFVGEWNTSGAPGWTRSDWNRDGKVDSLDFSGIFSTHWNEMW